MHYTTYDDKTVMDGVSGLWCCNAGHCHPKIVEAIQKQAETLDYATAFQLGHPTIFAMAEKLVDMAPEELTHAFSQILVQRLSIRLLKNCSCISSS